jgi:GTPase SAR1 family protein
MNLNLKAIKPARLPKPPRLILYGSPGVGKSTFAASISGSLFLDVEGGTLNLSVNRVQRDQLETYDDIIAALNAVLSQEHDFTSLIIDTADFMEKVLMKQAALEHGVSDYGKIGYGKGPVTVVNIWRNVTQILDDIREKRNMAIILIAHETLKRINEPDTETYDKYTLAMENKSIEHLESWCDAILFAKEEVYTQKDKTQRVRASAGDRMLFTRDCPRYLAKNRYNLPPELPFTWPAFSEAFAKGTAEETA